MKKIIALILTALTALISWSALADDALWRAAADEHVPEGAVLLRQEKDDGLWEYQYWVEATQEMYEIKIDPDTDRVVRVESDVWMNSGSRQVTLTEQEILERVQTLFPGAQVQNVTLEQDDGLYVYRIRFVTDSFAGQVELHPESGQVLEMELDYLQTTASASRPTSKPGNASKTTAKPASGDLIGKARAKEIAIKKAGGGTVIQIELDRENGRQVYEGEVVYGNYEYDFEIDALTGQILDWDKERRDD